MSENRKTNVLREKRGQTLLETRLRSSPLFPVQMHCFDAGTESDNKLTFTGTRTPCPQICCFLTAGLDKSHSSFLRRGSFVYE